MDSAISAPRRLAEHTDEIEQEIRRLLAARSHRAAAYGADFARLWELASECMLGGKLLRPALLLGAFDALAPSWRPSLDARGSALRIAAGVELLHFSFLLHDDVIDEDLLRRGRPNLIGAVLQEAAQPDPVGARASAARLHWARSNGILLGDLLLSAAHQVFAREPLPPAVRLRLLDLLDETITDSVAGEQADVALSDGMRTSELGAVIEMSRLKTASYTFELPLRAAVILSGAEPPTEGAVIAVARQLGVAFQLQDDLLSTFGRADRHGKDAFSDLREGKETAIIAYARTTTAWPHIEPWFGRGDLSPERARSLQSRLLECGAAEFIRDLIEERLRAASAVIDRGSPALPPELQAFLWHLVATLNERES